MITDMVGYTRLSQRDEARALRLLEEHNEIIRDSVTSHGGREVKHTGDGFLVEFPSALQSVTTAIDIQRRLYDRNATAAELDRLSIRIGLHVGDVVHRDNDIFGDGVNIASRIEPLAEPNGICLSQAVQSQIWNKIDRPLESLGPRDLKNVDVPIEVFRLVLPWDERREEGVPKGSDRTRLAVLPLTAIVSEAEDAYFTDGMTEELIYTLSKVPGLRVIAQTSVMAYRGTSKTAREIGHELGVGSIVEGSVRKLGDRVRITVQLIDAETQEHLWSERYDRHLADVFEIQSEIAQEVASGLKGLLKAQAVVPHKPTKNVDAYTAYLKGRHFWQRRTRNGLLKAIDAFEEAIAIDAEFAKAYSGLADAYTVMANRGYEAPAAALERAKTAAQQALELDPHLAEAHASLGLAYLQFDNDLRASEASLVKAIERNPSYASAHQWLSGVLHGQMRNEEAIDHALKSIDLDPLSHIARVNAAAILSDLGRLDEAKEQLQRSIELEPDFDATYADLADLQAVLWDWRGAESTLDRALERDPNNASAMTMKALLALTHGRRPESEQLIANALRIGVRSVGQREKVARFYRYVDRTEDALATYREAEEDDLGNPMWALLASLACAEVGRTDEAASHLERAEQMAVHPYPKLRVWMDFAHGVQAAQRGRRAEAVACAERIAALDGFREAASSQMTLYTILGDIDMAFEHLEDALTVHDPWVTQITLDRMIEPLRSDPRYERALNIVGLAEALNVVRSE